MITNRFGPALMSGRVSHIAVHPGDNQKWYVGVASGRVWKSAKFGTTCTSGKPEIHGVQPRPFLIASAKHREHDASRAARNLARTRAPWRHDDKYVVVNIVLLDPFIPGADPTFAGLSTTTMELLASREEYQDRIYRLENYYSIDFKTDTDFDWGAGGGGDDDDSDPPVFPGGTGGGALTTLGAEQAFTVVADPAAAMPPAARTAATDYQDRVAKLQRSFTGALEQGNNLRTRTTAIRRALVDSPADLKMLDEAARFDQRVLAVLRKLRGDETLRGLESGSPSAIQQRVI